MRLDECYRLAEANYPLIKQYALIENVSDYKAENVLRDGLPKVAVNGQATYQSDVTAIPIEVPGMDKPTIDNDQYKLYVEIDQTIYQGNKINKESKIVDAQREIDKGRLAIEVYGIKKKVSQLFFGILLINEQIQQNALLAEDIEKAIERIRVGIDNGTAIESDFYALNANLLSTKQRDTELLLQKNAHYEMLGVYINEKIDDNTILIKPGQIESGNTLINRPELDVIDSQIRLFDLQSKLLTSKVSPKLSFFAQGGYGKPALNMLSNEFDSYFMGGARFQWSLFNFYTNKNEKKIIGLEKQKLSVQKETFLFHTNLELTNQNSEVEKYRQLLAMDDEIIEMYSKIKEASLFKLSNGTIDVNDYLRDVNQESRAIQNKLLHELKLLMILEESKITQGIKY
ncbi:TolC family protein [Muricauda sp. 334s03]|uniref:TolC family protein n=2 Tax=Flagellimonas TaxID=444459 RepID=A0ABT5XNH8_9FLAO|nr:MULTISPECIES: TolC family protein [Allomuricauda]MDF0707437.1 TolC family protein [[Muricauda] okinawensis]MDF0715337.1 TolC family protein [[Muricauda] yonaguniensis]